MSSNTSQQSASKSASQSAIPILESQGSVNLFKSLPKSSELNFSFMYPDPKSVMESWPDWEALCLKLSPTVFQSLSYGEIVELKKDFDEFHAYYMAKMRIAVAGNYFPKEYKLIVDRKRELGCKKSRRIAKYYAEGISVSENESVNGYQLFRIKGEKNIFEYYEFEELMRIWDLWDKVSDADFLDWLEENCCTDWNKQDRNGECYGGFWKYPKGSNEEENAWWLSREDNFAGLLELPFPREIIKKTITMGCYNRKESVRYSNFICTWLQRKRNYMANPGVRDPKIEDCD